LSNPGKLTLAPTRRTLVNTTTITSLVQTDRHLEVANAGSGQSIRNHDHPGFLSRIVGTTTVRAGRNLRVREREGEFCSVDKSRTRRRRSRLVECIVNGITSHGNVMKRSSDQTSCIAATSISGGHGHGLAVFSGTPEVEGEITKGVGCRITRRTEIEISRLFVLRKKNFHEN
jgi:hypothetical protein